MSGLAGKGKLQTAASEEQHVRLSGKTFNVRFQTKPEGAMVVIAVPRHLAVCEIVVAGISIGWAREDAIRAKLEHEWADDAAQNYQDIQDWPQCQNPHGRLSANGFMIRE